MEEGNLKETDQTTIPNQIIKPRDGKLAEQQEQKIARKDQGNGPQRPIGHLAPHRGQKEGVRNLHPIDDIAVILKQRAQLARRHFRQHHQRVEPIDRLYFWVKVGRSPRMNQGPGGDIAFE